MGVTDRGKFIVLIYIIFFPFILLHRQSPLSLKVSSAFSLITMGIFIFNKRLFLAHNRVSLPYLFFFFNIFYFLFKTILQTCRRVGGNAFGLGMQFVFAFLIALVSITSLATALTNTHQRFFLDELSTKHLGWSVLKDLEAGTQIVYFPNVAILKPLIETFCSAWGNVEINPV